MKDLGFYPLLFSSLMRYFILAGLGFTLFYILFKQQWLHRRIQPGFPKITDYLREIGTSLVTILLFAANGWLIFQTPLHTYSQIYFDINDYPLWYLPISFLGAILIHDTYFYWSHRLMHHKKLFRIFHLVHHQSTNPSPWATFAFHPLEGIVETAVIYLIIFIIPIHTLTIVAFLAFNTAYSVYGHLGFEIFPKWLIKSSIGKWLNTATNHNMHHQYFQHNYALYFRFWDEIMNTTHPSYEAKIDKLTDYFKLPI